MTTKNDIEKLGPWFHNIHLPDGRQTAPDHFLGDFPSYKWDKIKEVIPADLDGWKVLDVGCNAGYYAVELALRGAQVTAIDLDAHYLKQAEWVIRKFDITDKITFRQMQVYDMAHYDETYDLIWFMGVFYHLRYPLFALDILAQKTRKMMVMQTFSVPGKKETHVPDDIDLGEREMLKHTDWPSLAFIEHKLAGDPTNWWVPNTSCVQAMLRSCGFTIAAIPEEETFVGLKNTDSPSNINSWNASEFLSATGKKWYDEVGKKTNKQ